MRRIGQAKNMKTKAASGCADAAFDIIAGPLFGGLFVFGRCGSLADDPACGA